MHIISMLVVVFAVVVLATFVFWLAGYVAYLRWDEFAYASRDMWLHWFGLSAQSRPQGGRYGIPRAFGGGLLGAMTIAAPLYLAANRRKIARVLDTLEHHCAAVGAEQRGFMVYAVHDLRSFIVSLRGEMWVSDVASVRARLAECAEIIRSLNERVSALKEAQELLDKVAAQFATVSELHGSEEESRETVLQVGVRIGELRQIRLSFRDPVALSLVQQELRELHEVLAQTLCGDTASSTAFGTDRSAWEVLGVASGASAEEASRAYHEKMRTYHPDVVKAALELISNERVRRELEEYFHRRAQEINRAYETLKGA